MKFNEASKILKAQKELRVGLKQSVEMMGTEAQNHFIKSFRNQGFEDETVQRWQPRKGQINSKIARVRKRYSDNGSRAILVKSGALRRSLFKYRSGILSVTIKSPLPYASVHNDGLIAKAYGRNSFKMPKRQFVGDSKKLERTIRFKIEKRISQVFQL